MSSRQAHAKWGRKYGIVDRITLICYSISMFKRDRGGEAFDQCDVKVIASYINVK